MENYNNTIQYINKVFSEEFNPNHMLNLQEYNGLYLKYLRWIDTLKNNLSQNDLKWMRKNHKNYIGKKDGEYPNTNILSIDEVCYSLWYSVIRKHNNTLLNEYHQNKNKKEIKKYINSLKDTENYLRYIQDISSSEIIADYYKDQFFNDEYILNEKFLWYDVDIVILEKILETIIDNTPNYSINFNQSSPKLIKLLYKFDFINLFVSSIKKLCESFQMTSYEQANFTKSYYEYEVIIREIIHSFDTDHIFYELVENKFKEIFDNNDALNALVKFNSTDGCFNYFEKYIKNITLYEEKYIESLREKIFKNNEDKCIVLNRNSIIGKQKKILNHQLQKPIFNIECKNKQINFTPFIIQPYTWKLKEPYFANIKICEPFLSVVEEAKKTFSKQFSNRKLIFLHGESFCTIVVNLNNCSYNLSCTVLQACVIFLFDKVDTISISNIIQELNIKINDLMPCIEALIKKRLLKIENDYLKLVDEKYHNQVIYSVPSRESICLHKQLFEKEDLIKASVVKYMKLNKTCEKNNLYKIILEKYIITEDIFTNLLKSLINSCYLELENNTVIYVS